LGEIGRGLFIIP